MNRKYGAVKIGTLRYFPVTLEFVEQKESKEKSLAQGSKSRIIRYFLVIDSKNSQTSVSIDNVEEITEHPEKKTLNIVYNLADGTNKDGTKKFTRKSESFECCENFVIIKTFNSIRK